MDDHEEHYRALNRHLRLLQFSFDLVKTTEMEPVLAATQPCGPEIPGSCHPFYLPRREFIVNWLQWRPEIRTGTYYDLFLPVLRVPKFYSSPPADIPYDRPRYTRLTRLTPAYGRAPYVGEPYFYTWDVAEDALGRTVTSEARQEPGDVRPCLRARIPNPW